MDGTQVMRQDKEEEILRPGEASRTYEDLHAMKKDRVVAKGLVRDSMEDVRLAFVVLWPRGLA